MLNGMCRTCSIKAIREGKTLSYVPILRYEVDPEKSREYCKKYGQKNKTILIEKTKKWISENRERHNRNQNNSYYNRVARALEMLNGPDVKAD
jgi:hypothetical protein